MMKHYIALRDYDHSNSTNLRSKFLELFLFYLQLLVLTDLHDLRIFNIEILKTNFDTGVLLIHFLYRLRITFIFV